MSARKIPPQLEPWVRSGNIGRIGAAALARFRTERANAPVCGARTKKTGEPCQQQAMKNGRCRVHGGLTPRGDQWHVVQWPSRDSRRPEKKLLAKLEILKRRQEARDARLAAMTPEERAKHEKWHRRHRAGSAAARRAQCDELRQNAETVARLAALDTPRPKSPGAQALADLAAWLEADAARMESEIAEEDIG